MDSIAYAYAAMTAASAQAPNAVPMHVQHSALRSQYRPVPAQDSVQLLPTMVANAAARIKGQVSVTPFDTFAGVWSPPPRREPL